MGITERAAHIKNLIALKDFCNNNGVFTLASNIEQSLDYAISSLKTDEAYQIMYEGGEIFTKADMVDMLKDLRLDIEAKENYYEQAFKEPSNAVHESAMCGRMFGCGECKEVIQQKIDALRKETNNVDTDAEQTEDR